MTSTSTQAAHKAIPASHASGVVSNLDDMMIWAPALATGVLLTPELQRERLTFVPTTDDPDGPGYGLAG